jgi:guanine nucleotide-binding protein subunit alpha
LTRAIPKFRANRYPKLSFPPTGNKLPSNNQPTNPPGTNHNPSWIRFVILAARYPYSPKPEIGVSRFVRKVARFFITMCMGGDIDLDAKRHNEIEKLIRQDEKRLAKEVKLLLLGEFDEFYKHWAAASHLLRSSR